MKARMGFVTNSSSVNFTVWGLSVEESMIKQEILDKVKKDEECLEEELEELTGLSYDNDEYQDIALGKSPSDMVNNETLSEFKKGIVELLNKILKKPISINDIEYIERHYYN